MNTLSKLSDWQAVRKQLNGRTIGFVPTMGNLHAGHMQLCDRAKQENEIVVLSIFVNPTQFNQSSDFDLYPRTMDADIALAKTHGVDYLFIPDAAEIYHDDYHIKISENDISSVLEGEFRPGHFEGMLTVVAKLFGLVQPDRAYFGEKDYQQLQLVKKMVSALFMPIDVIGCKTMRAEDGLALSSRNNRLTTADRQLAANLPRILQSSVSEEMMIAELTKLGFKVEYIAEKWQRRLAAVWLGGVRLIDNVEI